ncbi:hypothetical protein [Nitrosopumilus zosterae]|uniref:hypothetical protein n=1 Tax=Nitrosopumilus zosterae TaxID=718286 RepID=UPI0011B23781|nr:hypothetical protein [Nitrosopumilus zosterae]BDQ30600.1 hypothetical protein NZOSNM25_000706 [Nitrosopumilus zosterae]
MLTIVKILAEHGPSTISEIVEKDGFPQEKKRKLTRHKIYSRIIEGSKDGKVKGLLPHNILHVAEKVLTSKPSKKYELSYYGIFLAIRVFAQDDFSLVNNMEKIGRDRFDEVQKQFITDNMIFLENLAKNYSIFLPLIFGKWEFIKNKFPDGADYLIKFAKEGYYEQDQIEYDEPFMNSTIIEDLYPENSSFHFFPEHFDWKEGNFFQEEITMWFYTLLLKSHQEYDFQQNLRIDQEVLTWFTNHTNRVIARQKELLSNAKNIKRWLQKNKSEKIEEFLQIALDGMSSNYWKKDHKLSQLQKNILKIENEIDKITITENGMGRILDMEKYKKLIDEIEPLRMNLRDKTRKKIIKIMENRKFSKKLVIEYLSEIHYILESKYSERLFTISLGGGKKPGWGDIPIRQVPPEELRRWIRRNNWDVS